MAIYETTNRGEIEMKKGIRGLATGWGTVWKQVKAIHNHENKCKVLHPSRRASFVPRRLLDAVTTGDDKIWDYLSKTGVQSLNLTSLSTHVTGRPSVVAEKINGEAVPGKP